MKFTPSEAKLVELIKAVGGSHTISYDAPATPAVHRLVRKLQRKGVLTVESFDGIERITLTGAHNAN